MRGAVFALAADPCNEAAPASKTANDLDTEIDRERNNLRTDKLDISYGELASLYETAELVIAPEYQRFFRWSADFINRIVGTYSSGVQDFRGSRAPWKNRRKSLRNG
jgi:hypothetical protein